MNCTHREWPVRSVKRFHITPNHDPVHGGTRYRIDYTRNGVRYVACHTAPLPGESLLSSARAAGRKLHAYWDHTA